MSTTTPPASPPRDAAITPPRSPASREWAYKPLPPSQPGAVLRFCDADSAALEDAYAERRTAVDAAWWAESASLAAHAPGGGGSGRGGSASTSADASDPLLAAPANGVPVGDWGAFLAADGAAGGGVLVRAGAWEVDLEKRRASACYAPAPPVRVRRGTWFVEAGAGAWTPAAEGVADELETAYAAAPWRRGAARVDLAVPALDARGAAALFVGPDEAYLVKGGWGGASASAAPAPGARAPGPRLRRGYQPPPLPSADPSVDVRDEALAAAAAGAPVDALVLAVHGIGQTMASSSIADDADALARSVAAADAAGAATVAPPSSSASPPPSGARTPPHPAAAGAPPRRRGRVAVVPVQWRKHLALDVDAVARAVAPATLSAVRGAMHATCVEVLLYMTPLHAQDMVDSLVGALNSQVARFVARHPDFDGPISIVAHSLGSLLCFDVLTAQAASLARLTGRVAGDGVGAAPPSPPRAALPADLTDLGPVLSPSSTREERRLRAEVASLRGQLASLRARVATGGGASPPPPAADAAAGEPGPGVLTVAPLTFDVATLITVGSPLGLFLALRQINPAAGRGLGTPAAAPLAPSAAPGADGLPAVARWYNVYHPYDPIAYRCEPLATPTPPPRPVPVPRTASTGTGVAAGLREAAGDAADALSAGAAAAAGALAAGLRGLKRGASAVAAAAGVVRVERVPPADASTETEPEDAGGGGGDAPLGGADAASALRRVVGGVPPRPASPRAPSSAIGRLDFALQPSPTENSYISALSAHFAYWGHADVGLFVARAVRGADVRGGAARAVAPAAPAAATKEEAVRSHALAV